MSVIKKEFIDAFCTQINKVVKIHLYSLFLIVQVKKNTFESSTTFRHICSTYCTLIIFLQEPVITGESVSFVLIVSGKY